MTEVRIHGPGSSADGRRVADALARGIEGGADAVAAATGAVSPQIGRLRMRLPAGAGEAEIARAFARALDAHLRERS